MASKEGNTTVRVRIGGEEHAVRGNAPAEYIRELASIVDGNIKIVQRNNPNLTRHRVAILVALNMADELEKLRTEYEELLQLVEEAN